MPWNSTEDDLLSQCRKLLEPCTQEKADSRSPEVPILEGADDLTCFRLCLKPEDDTDVGWVQWVGGLLAFPTPPSCYR
jgi:hypothetical protein